MTDAEVGEHLNEQGTAAGTTNADLELTDSGLPEITEETRVPVVAGSTAGLLAASDGTVVQLPDVT